MIEWNLRQILQISLKIRNKQNETKVMKMIKTKCSNSGLCCESCQEPVNIHRCNYCDEEFYDDDEIYCEHHSQTDCIHYHSKCNYIDILFGFVSWKDI